MSSTFGHIIEQTIEKPKYYIKTGITLEDAKAAVDRATPEQFQTMVMAYMQNDLLHGFQGMYQDGTLTSNGMYRWAMLERLEREGGSTSMHGWRVEVRKRQSEMHAEHEALMEIPT